MAQSRLAPRPWLTFFLPSPSSSSTAPFNTDTQIATRPSGESSASIFTSASWARVPRPVNVILAPVMSKVSSSPSTTNTSVEERARTGQ